MTIPAYSLDHLTLCQAIEHLRRSEDTDNQVSNAFMPVIGTVFDQHDAVHAIFGLGTSIEDEIAAHAWMVFATTAKVRDMHRAVASEEHRRVLDGIGHGQLMGRWIRMIPRLSSIAWHSLRMPQRLPLHEFDDLGVRSLGDIRREFRLPQPF